MNVRMIDDTPALAGKPIYVLYNPAECSKPQIAKALMNVLTSMYFKTLTQDWVQLQFITSTDGLPPESIILCYSTKAAKQFIFDGKQNNYRGSVYVEPATQHIYIIGCGLGGIRTMLIGTPKDDEQEKLVIKTYYGTAADLYKAYRFSRGLLPLPTKQGAMPEFNYQLISTYEEWLDAKQEILDCGDKLVAISFDIETAGFPTFISAFGYTLVIKDDTRPDNLRYISKCIAMGVHNYVWHHNAMRFICEHPAPKIAHNGSYDCNVLLRYRIPVRNMMFDTYLMAHSLRCDSLKSLAFTASFYLPDYQFWKDEIAGVENNGKASRSEKEGEEDNDDKHGVPATNAGRIIYYRYCGKDTFNTARICRAMLDEFHQKPWAVRNYCLVHFLQYRVGMFMGLAGMPIDESKWDAFVANVAAKQQELLSELRTYAKDEMFNPSSTSEAQEYIYRTLGLDLPRGIRLKPEPKRKVQAKVKPQTVRNISDDDLYFTVVDLNAPKASQLAEQKDISLYPTDKKAIRFLIDQNPAFESKLKPLLEYRWYSRVLSTYLLPTTTLVDSQQDKHVKVLLYKPNISATVTCRFGGSKHDLHVGAYHLNLPPELWDCIKIPDGYLRYSIDYSHSDDYFVAFYSGCKTMMENVVRTDIDLHMKHAAMVFQRDYDLLMQHKKDKEHEAPLLRKLSKSIGHGCKYLMGGYTMYVNMGDPNVVAAGKALGHDLERASLDDKIKMASELQQLFYKQYDGLTQWHVDVYRKLLSDPQRLITVGNWTRQLLSPAGWFSVRSGSVAQYGQAGTSSNSNAFLRKFFRAPLNKCSYIFAQVHDAMDGFATSTEEIERIASVMEEPITVTDIYGNTRTFSVKTETETFKP